MRPWPPLLLTALLAAMPAWSAPAEVPVAGDASRGRALLLQRQDSGCILCHVVPGLPGGGELGPPLVGLAQRYNPVTLGQRIADARRYNPDTIMPPYRSTEGLRNVARQQQGRTVLSEQGLADIVAWLLTAQGAADGAR